MLSTNSTTSSDLRNRGDLADWAGMIASIGCAVHCAAMPLVLAYLPSFGPGWLAGEGFHRWMAVVCFLLAAAAFVPGWRKHRSVLPAAWAAVGLLLLTTAAFGLEDSCCASCAPSDAASTTMDADCAACHSTGGDEPSTGGDEPSTFVASSATTPFITPVGGFLLVIGHIANHRKSCACLGIVCCLSGHDEAIETSLQGVHPSTNSTA